MEGNDNYRSRLGKIGEDLACRLLEDMGHVILERNWRSGHLEIDIISVASDGIHFVEVKTRRMNIQAPPQENVNRTKQTRIAKAATRYLKNRNGYSYGNLECSFDVIAITFNGDEAQTEWIPQAYIPIYI